MHSKSFAAAIFLLALTSFVNADSLIVVAPGLNVPTDPGASDVKKPTPTDPCGSGINIAQTVNTATCVKPNANGDFEFSLFSFGSTTGSITSVKVDPSGTGQNFTSAQIVKNSDASTSGGKQDIVIGIPIGTQCKGGTSGGLCLLSFVGPDKSGNCAVISQPPTNTTKPDNAPPVTSPTPTPKPHGQSGDAPVASPSPSPLPHGAVGEKGQEAGDANNKGKTGGNGNVNKSNNGNTDTKSNNTTTPNKGLKREPVQGKRLWGSR